MSAGVANLLGYAHKGTEFLFGPSASNPLANTFAIAALPVIIFFASLVAILYYLGIMQRVVRWIGGAIGWVTGISRVESLCAAANIFVGQSESPLVIRPYLAGPAPVAAVHRDDRRHGRRRRHDPGRLCQPARPELSALSARRRLHVGAGRHPDGQDHHARRAWATAKPREDANVDVAETFEEGEKPANIIMAAAQGAQTGVKLAVAVGAMVLAFVALVALANGLLGGLGDWFGDSGPQLPADRRLSLRSRSCS